MGFLLLLWSLLWLAAAAAVVVRLLLILMDVLVQRLAIGVSSSPVFCTPRALYWSLNRPAMRGDREAKLDTKN